MPAWRPQGARITSYNVCYTKLLRTELQLELHLAHGDATGPWANCTGIVAWRNTAEQPRRPNHPPGYGIKFTDLPMQALGILV